MIEKKTARKIVVVLGALWGLFSMLPYAGMVAGYVRPDMAVRIMTFPAFVIFDSGEWFAKILPWDIFVILGKILLIAPPFIGAMIFYSVYFLLKKIKKR